MVKHNNILPDQHYHKMWNGVHAPVAHGLKPTVNFQQPCQKKARRLKRKAKAAAIAPRPVGLLRPVVHCQSARYKHKVRAGRGFTLEELKEAGILKKEAMNIGISVDHRRTNLSVESLQANAQRLKAYKAKLIIFPRKRNSKPKQGDSSADETKTATQTSLGDALPITQETVTDALETVKLTADMKAYSGYREIRLARSEAKKWGQIAKRKVMLKERAEQKKKSGGKKKKK